MGTAVLDGSSGEDLVATALEIAAGRSLSLARTWIMQKVTRTAFIAALESLSRRIAKGGRVRLLCHCRPHVRCHTEYLKAHLELQATPAIGVGPHAGAKQAAETQGTNVTSLWPSFDGDGPRCAQCGRQGRALDPGNMNM